jgi:hypothetical protein
MKVIINLKNLEMKNTIFLFLAFLWLTGLLVSCEKDETIVKLTENPVLPKVVTLPNLIFDKAHENDTIVFVCSPIDFGYGISAKYALEAVVSGKEFSTKETMRIYYGDDYAEIKTTIIKVNKLFKGKKIVAGTKSAVDFRIRAVLTVDAGSGALGSSTNPLEYISETVTDSTITY